MTAALDIHDTQIETRLIGDSNDAGRLDHCLRDLLTTKVLPMSAKAMDPGFGEDEIICVPDLNIHLRTTLAEAMSGEAAHSWSVAMVNALDGQIGRGDKVWRFENRWAFLAHYLNARLGLNATPASVFTGLSALDVLSPLQAMVEALRAWPKVWIHLAHGSVEDIVALVDAIEEQGGHTAFDQSLSVLSDQSVHGGHSTGNTDDLVVHLLDIANGSSDMIPIMRAQAARMFDGKLTLFSILLVQASGIQNAVQIGLAVSVIFQALRSHRGTEGNIQDHIKRAVERQPKGLHRDAKRVIASLMATRAGSNALGEIMHKWDQKPTAQGPERAKPNPVDPPRSDYQDASGEAHETTNTGRFYTSPVAGVALCLPFLTENHIGAAFPADVRRAALARLAGDDTLGDPLSDPLIAALCGEGETDIDTLQRPNDMDMLFVSDERRAAIKAAVSAIDKLALWVEARFAASLPGLDSSSRAFLRSQFFHRAGRLTLTEETALIEIDTMPLRPVLEMADLLGDDRGRLTWLKGQKIEIRLREGAK